MPDDVVLRNATVEDADGIARVHIATWQAAYRGIVPDDYLDAMDVGDRTARWRNVLEHPNGPTWVAASDEAVVGWANAGPARDTDTRAAPGELYGIYVRSDWWGRGAAPPLMTEALAWLRERYPEATLWTLEANARARRFYEKFGWRFDGTTRQDDRGSFVLHEVRYRIEL
jgi:GNAT superfamily N-acetyltransferase